MPELESKDPPAEMLDCIISLNADADDADEKYF